MNDERTSDPNRPRASSRGRSTAQAVALLFLLSALPSRGQAGLLEKLADRGEDGAAGQSEEAKPAADSPPGPQLWGTPIVTAPRRARLFDPRLDPILLIRGVWVATEEDKGIVFTDESGMEVELDSTRMDPSLFGHREGFVLENVEFGLTGRFNDSGIYYTGKFDLVPREKDGNRSSDYLKDAYFGWNRFRFADIRLGRMKIPFSRLNNKSTASYPLIYSPTIDTLIPKRQLGAMLSLGDHWKVARVTGGVYNSVASAQEQITLTKQLLYVGRVDLRLHNILEAALGGAARSGLDHVGFALEGGLSFASVERNYDPPTEHRWFGLDARLRIWRFNLEAETVFKDFFYEEHDPETGLMQLLADRGKGWHLDLVIEVWPEVIDIVGRVEEMDGDILERGLDSSLTISEISKQRKRWITAGLSLKLSQCAKLSFNYINRKELEGYSFDNDVWLLMAQFDL